MPEATPDAVRPLGFLDVDGVLNSFGADPNDPHRHRTVLRYNSIHLRRERYSTVTLDRRHPKLLARLGTHLELAWATAWEHDANPGLCEVLGLPTLPVVDFDLGRRHPKVPVGLHWKTLTLAARSAGSTTSTGPPTRGGSTPPATAHT